jgi:transcriptional regulator with PAS, ATPase and Fis domain
MAASDRRPRVIASLAALGHPIDAVETLSEAMQSMRRAMPDIVVLSEDPAGEPVQDTIAAVRRETRDVVLLLWPADAGSGDDAEIPELPRLPREVEPLPAAPGLGERARRRPPNRLELDPFLGESSEIRQLEQEARAGLASESPVLIEGETGTGKGVLAAWLHRNGPRAQRPFIDLNCAGFSRELMDSELFGHERGAFTGAITSKPGLLEVADGGTLFLDEIGDTDGPIQAKLLKVIEEKRFRRIGETRERQVNVRIIAATHHDLPQLVREGRFREDLYYRIRVLSLRIPPLRARAADLGGLVQAITSSIARDLGRASSGVSDVAQRNIAGRFWPGNLRELRNTLERAMLAAGDAPIGPEHLGLEEGAPARRAGDLSGGTLIEIERAYIENVLKEEQNVTRAAQRLGMARSTLYQRLHALGITRRS